MTKSESIIYSTIELSHLMDFKNHVFIKYEEKELQSMMLSIKEIGVINPIVVRPHNQFEGMYEIISGHNRVEACKRIGEKEIHAIIYKNIPNDIIAELMLIESNLKQRSINNSKITEKARVISRRYELIIGK
jgi:ParB family chromosome partitioning protein